MMEEEEEGVKIGLNFADVICECPLMFHYVTLSILCGFSTKFFTWQ
jgi:hypothetical protein